LYENEKKISTLVQNIPGMIYRASPDWWVEVISGGEDVCGYTENELNSIQNNWPSIIHPDDKERVFNESSEMTQIEKTIVQTYRIVDKNQKIRWVEDRKTSFFSAQGNFIGIDGVVFDITERKKMEAEKDTIFQQLLESEDKFRLITENAKDMIYRMSLPDGTYEYVSSAAKEIFGYEPDVFYNSPILIQNLIHPDWETYFQGQWEKLVKGNMPPSYEYQIINPKGETRWLNQRNLLIRDMEGIPSAIEGVVTDITERKVAEQLLEKERKQLKSLFDATKDVIYVADPENHKLLFVNRDFRNNLGDNAVGKICYEVLQNRDSPCPFCTNNKIFGDNIGKTYVWEFHNEVDDRWYQCADKAIRWSDGKWVRFEVATDITDEKIFRQEQIRLEKFSALGQVAAGVAHELNNPLMGVLNYAQYCLSETSKDDERHALLKDIETETKRCVEIVGHFLNASRQDDITAGKAESFDPKTVIQSVLKLLEYRTGKEGVDISTDFSSEIPYLLMSRDAFQQLFLNLISNALDALEDSKKKKVVVKAEKESENLLLSIIDSGCGIPPDLKEKIFDPFFTTKPPGKGTGLGLATSWKIVTSQNGHIQCRSREELGTEMIVKLPITMKKGNYHKGMV
jgi:PAS domain S-box-containing protein